MPKKSHTRLNTKARPKWIQMFRIKRGSKRSKGSSERERDRMIENENENEDQDRYQYKDEDEDHYEVSLLKRGQQIDINELEQLELLCLVSNSKPEATIKWTSQKLASSLIQSLNVDDGNEKGLSLSELLRLLRQIKDEPKYQGKLSEEAKLLTEFDLEGKQWSSFVRFPMNLTFHDYGTKIACQASHNYQSDWLNTTTNKIVGEKQASEANMNQAAATTTISFEVQLNISRRPLLELDIIDRESMSYNGTEAMGYVPLGRGQDISFICKLRYSNPAIDSKSSIEWFINETQPLFDSKGLIPSHLRETIILERQDKIEPEKLSSEERIRVRIEKDGPIELHCGARNTLGYSESNKISLYVAQKPRCDPEYGNRYLNSSKPLELSSILDETSSLSLKCPILLSDKSSAQYFWSPIVNNIKSSGNVNEIINGTPIISSSIDTIDIEELNDQHRSMASTRAPITGHLSVDFTCFAKDKFGSNQNSPCYVIPISAFEYQRSGKLIYIHIYTSFEI